jgi:hypothetical protein
VCTYRQLREVGLLDRRKVHRNRVAAAAAQRDQIQEGMLPALVAGDAQLRGLALGHGFVQQRQLSGLCLRPGEDQQILVEQLRQSEPGELLEGLVGVYDREPVLCRVHDGDRQGVVVDAFQ